MIEYRPVPALEVFAEALAVPPMIHMPPGRPLRVIAFGPYALPLAKLALRYPETSEVYLVAIDKAPALQDKRVKVLQRLEDLPQEFKADMVGIAVPGDPAGIVRTLRGHMTPEGVLVLAVDRMDRGRVLKDSMAKLWRQVLPYREFTPEPALFLMASDKRFGKPVRPFPANLQRLTPRYFSNLFTLAKDEYRLLFGSETS